MDADYRGPFLPSPPLSLLCSTHTRRVTKACYSYKASVKAPKNRLPGQESRTVRPLVCDVKEPWSGWLTGPCAMAIQDAEWRRNKERRRRRQECASCLPASCLAPLPARLVSSMMAPFVLTTTEEKKKGRREGGKEGRGGRRRRRRRVAGRRSKEDESSSLPPSLPPSLSTRAAQASRHLISSACDLCSSLLGAVH